MSFFHRAPRPAPAHFWPLSLLHVLNDGFMASYLLLLPFVARAQGLNLTQVGSLGTVLNVASIVLALPAGYIAARMGGLKVLVTALFIYALALLGVGVFGQYYVLLVMFAVGGAGLGVFHPIAFALIAKWSSKETRGRAMGSFTAIGDVGRIGISAVLSLVVVFLGWRQTAALYAAAALVGGMVFWRFLRSQDDAVAAKEQKIANLTLWQIVKNRQYIFATGTATIDAFASASLYVFLPFLLLKRGVSPALLGTFTAVFFAGNLLGKVALGRYVDKVGNARVFIVSELLMAGFIFLLANSTSVYVVIVSSLVLGMFTKGTLPVLQTMISESVEHHGNFEKAFGVSAFSTSAAVTAAPLLLGIVSDKWGIVAAFNIMAAAALCAILPASGYVLARRYRKVADHPA